MLPTLRSRRRPRYGAHVCALIAALLLLLSVSLLHTRLSQPQHILHHHHHHQISQSDAALVQIDPLLSDSDDSSSSSNFREDKIDELDTVDEDQHNDNDDDDDDAGAVSDQDSSKVSSSSSYYFDHITGSIRRAFNKRSIDDWDYDYTGLRFTLRSSANDEKIKSVFGSDDVPVDEETRRKMSEVRVVEDVLLLKLGKGVSPLRAKWGEWFDKKSEFLRRDRMFKSHLEVLNPANNPLLQDPDGVGVTGLTRGDKVLHKWLLNEFKRVPFLIRKKPLGVVETKRTDRRTLDDDNVSEKGLSVSGNERNLSNESDGSRDGSGDERKNEFSSHVYADGRRWGYYPGLDPRLSFTGFMDAFFRKGTCSIRVFMVWNSPPWMFSVRHQRGLESVLVHHRDACVVVLSETIELDFFRDNFVKDG